MNILRNSSLAPSVFNGVHTETDKTKQSSIIPSQKLPKTNSVIKKFVKVQKTSKSEQKIKQPQDISSHLIEHHCKKGNPLEASFIFNRMVQSKDRPSFEITANLIKLFVNSKQLTEAENVVEKMEEWDRKYNKADAQDSKKKLQFELLISYLGTNHIEEARKLLESLRASGTQCPQTIYLRFLDQYIKENSIEAVKMVSKEYLGTLPEKKTEELIAYCKQNNLKEAEVFLQRFRSNEKNRNVLVLQILVERCLGQKEWTHAHLILEEIKKNYSTSHLLHTLILQQFELVISSLDATHIEEARKFLESLRAFRLQCPQTIYLRFLDRYLKEVSIEAVKIVTKEYLGTLSGKRTEEFITYCKQNNLTDAEEFLQRLSIEQNRSLLILQILVERCLKQKDWTQVDLIAKEIKRNHSSSYLLHTLVLHQFRHYFEQEEIDQCKTVLETLKYRTIEQSPLSDWFKDYCLNGQTEKAERMLDLLHSVEIQIQIGDYQPLITDYVHNKKWAELDLLFEKVNTKSKGSVLALHPFLMTCFAAQEVEKAREFYDKICSCSKPSKATYDILIEGFLENDCLSDIEIVIDVMRKKKVKYNAVIFSSLIKVYSKYEDIDQVDMLYKSMAKRKIEPCDGTYKSLLLAYCKNGCVEKAEKLWHRLTKDRTLSDPQFYLILFECYCKEGELKKAQDLLETMKSLNIEIDIYLYNSFLDGHLFLDQYEEACLVQKEMEGKNLKFNASSYNCFFTYYCRKGQIKEAEDLFNKMEQNGVVPTRICFVHFVKYYCFTGDFEKAFETLKKMQEYKIQPDIDMMNYFIKGHVLQGAPEKAQEVLQNLISYRLYPNAYSYHTVIEGFLDRGQFTQAQEIMNEMWNAKFICKIYYLNRLIKGFISVGEEQKSEDLFYRLFNLNPQPNQGTYSVLMGHYFLTEQFEKIEKLIGMMAKNGLQPTADTMNRLINGYVQKQAWHRLEVALELAEELKFSVNPWLYFTFIKNYARENAFDRIAQLLSTLEIRFPDESPKIYQEVFILFCLEDKMKEEGCKKWVVSWLKENKIPSSRELNQRLIDGYWAKGHIDHALFLESKMNRPASLENQTKEHVFQAPEKEKIQVIVEEKYMGKKKVNYDGYLLLLSDHCEKKEFEEAECLLAEMKKEGLKPNEDIYLILISHYLKAKQMTNAERCLDRMRKEDGIIPSILVGNLFINAHFQARKRLSAEKEFKKWEEMANLETYSILIREYCRLGYTEKVKQFLSTRETDKPILGDVFIGALIEKKLFEKAITFFDALEIDIPTKDSNGISVKDCRMLRKWETVAFIYKELKNKNSFHFYLGQDKTQVLKMVDNEFPKLHPNLSVDYLILSEVSRVKRAKQSESLEESIH